MECQFIRSLASTLPKSEGELGVLLYNLFTSLEASTVHGVSHVYVAISLSRTWYKRPVSYMKQLHLSYSRMKRVVDYLEKNQYISVKKGYWNAKANRGLRTLIQPLPKLSSILRAHTSTHRFKIPKRTGLLIMKDSSKVAIKYTPTSQTRAMKTNLDTINKSNARHSFTAVAIQFYLFTVKALSIPLVSATLVISCNIKYIYKYQLKYDRVFNTSFLKGGRFYCKLQNIPQNNRKDIFIDGRPTVELDYEAHHPRIAYNLSGLNLILDPYDISIPNIRPIVKLAFLIMMNIKNNNYVVQALADALKKEGISVPPSVRLIDVVKKLEILHSSISNYFYKSAALDFQYIDSQIAEGVMLTFANQNKPCFSVHDSFVVRAEDEHFYDLQ
jgi:hypothetical protein